MALDDADGALSALWREPIPGALPTGVDPRYVDDHVALRAELEKLESLSAAAVDWETVERLAVGVLGSTSKDLFAASALAIALTERRGLLGLVDGLGLVVSLWRAFAEHLHPQRPKARAGALGWLIQRAVSLLARASQAVPNAVQERLLSTVDALQNEARGMLGPDAPHLGELRNAVQRLVTVDAVAAPSAAPVVAPTTAPVAPASVASSPAAPAPPQPSASPAAEGGSATDPRLEPWLRAISEAEPAGGDSKYEDEAVSLRAELEKLENLSGARPDWARVCEVAQSLLSTRSKDLGYTSALAVALQQREGLAGLAVGIALNVEALRRYGDALWPRKARPRGRALEWLVQRATEALAGQEVTAAEAAVLARARANTDALHEAARQVLGADAPPFTPLRDALSRLALSLQQEPERVAPTKLAPPSPIPTVPVTQPANTPSISVSVVPSAPVAPAAADDVSGYLGQVASTLLSTGKALLAASGPSPLAARLVRAGLWLHLDSEPPHDGEGKTRIPPPDARLRESLAKMAEHGAWAGLLEHAEGCLEGARLWLDLHFYVDRALSGLGAGAEPRRRVCEAEVRVLVARMPRLAELRFADGTPLASAETRAWLSPAVPRDAPVAVTASAVEPTSLSAELRAALAQRQGDLAAPLAAAEQLCHQLSAGRERFVFRLGVAKALSEGGHMQCAVTLFESLDREASAVQLQTWEPRLALELYLSFIRAARSHARTNGVVYAGLSELCARVASTSLAALAQLSA